MSVWRTSWAWPGLSCPPLAAVSSNASSTTMGSIRRPSVRAAAVSSQASASSTARDV